MSYTDLNVGFKDCFETNKRVAAFITPHGFGHTTRAIAVLEALWRRCPGLAFEIFTTAAPHLFHQSLSGVTIHQVPCDVGFIQHDALNHDLPATVAALDRLLPFSPVLARFVEERLDGTILAENDFLDGSWLARLPELLTRRRPAPAAINGAERIAELLLSLPRG